MHNLQRLPALSGLSGWLVLAALFAVLLLVALPMGGARVVAGQEVELIGKYQYAAVGGLMMVFALCLLRLGASLSIRPLGACEGSFFFFILWCGFSSALSMMPMQSLLYVGATAGCYASCYAMWRVLDGKKVARVISLCGLVYVTFAAICLLTYGTGIGRFVGRMTPNHFAAVAGVGAMCCQLGRPAIRVIGGIVGLTLVTLVVARGMFVALGLFFAILYLRRLKHLLQSGHRMMPVVLLFGISLFAGVGLFILLDSSMAVQLGNYFDLFSEDRGMGSGVTGRLDNWVLGWQALRENPLFGIGFRMIKLTGIETTSHSSYIDMLREVGLVGSLLFAVLAAVSLKHFFGNRPPPSDEQADDIHPWAGAAVVAILFLSALEINLLTIAFPTGVLFMIALTKAPVDVNSQMVDPRRRNAQRIAQQRGRMS